jgi:aryl-alcohol dehydrogenase (NADP+)
MIPWSPLARGLLTRRPGNAQAEITSRAESDELLQLYQSSQDKEIVVAAARIADQRGVKLAQVALAWLLSNPVLIAPIVGVSKLQHLEDAAGAVKTKLTAEEIETLERPYEARPTMGITPPFRYPRPGAVHDRNPA